MRELKNEHANRRHEETASFKAASPTSSSGSRPDTPPPHDIMNMRNKERRTGLTQARVILSNQKRVRFRMGVGVGVKFSLSLVRRK